ncbi:cell division protein ZapA [Thalassotalea profundi]|uniref:Cell division protein ZapA n=1 Tax=Thalassotalea profundi TaxID=2036687 RepID=A0ABQ3IIX7_9GAMM|nr:cell division protein ZapA [Thalassotalea profundi]GHE85849.1 cell division protein ZapA [Thalassotalea profundi]
MSQHSVTIDIANRRMKIACPKGQETSLLQAAQEVNERLAKVQQQSNTTKTPEQNLLMTALNLANDLLISQQKQAQEKIAMQNQIDLLQSTIQKAVGQNKKKA